MKGAISMLNICATSLADCLFRNYPLDENQKPVYIYGFQLFLSSAAAMVSIFVLSCLLQAAYTSFVFSTIFVSIRLFSGGYHAKTYGKCFAISNTIFLACFFLAKIMQELSFDFICPYLVCFSLLVIVALTPIRHKNHPISDMTYQKNKRISRALALFESLCVLTAYFFSLAPSFISMASVTLTAVAVMMIVPKCLERGGKA